MKLAFGLITGFLTLAFGIVAASWIGQSSIAEPRLMDADYSFGVNELVSTGDAFDGKKVRVHGSWEPFEHHPNFGNLSGSAPNWIETVCVADEDVCSRIRATRSEWDHSTYVGPEEMDVEVDGRYYADTVDPNPDARGETIRLLAISDVISVKHTDLDDPTTAKQNDRSKGKPHRGGGSGCGRCR